MYFIRLTFTNFQMISKKFEYRAEGGKQITFKGALFANLQKFILVIIGDKFREREMVTFWLKYIYPF